MELYIYDIPEAGLDLSFDVVRDTWLKRVIVEALGDAFSADDTATLELRLERMDEDIEIRGELALTSHPQCDRCVELYREEIRLPIHTHLSPLYENERQREREAGEGVDVELVKEDLEFSYYEGDRLHLDEIIAEQTVLALPMQHLCDEACKGLCQRCGKNLNLGACGCRQEATDARWDALKDLKIAQKP